MVLGRGLTFFYDEWDFVDNRSRSFLSFDLSSHNGHPVVIPYAVYRAAFALIGLGTTGRTSCWWCYSTSPVAGSSLPFSVAVSTP